MKRHYTLSGLLLCLMTLFTLSASAAPDKDYLCFTAETAGSTVKLIKFGSPTAVTIEYSTDGTTWSTYTFSTDITLTNVGDKVYFRNASSGVTTFSKGLSRCYYFGMSGTIAASGNVMSLIDSTCSATNIPSGYCFCNLFANCDALTSAPELPATILKQFCYQSMFEGCTALNFVKVGFSDFGTNTTPDWLSNVASKGIFLCPDALSTSLASTTRSASNVPEGWSINGYDLTVSAVGWASMYLPIDVTIPEDVEVYYAASASGDVVTLKPITDIIPACTGVIVKADEGTVFFPYPTTAATPVEGNLYEGVTSATACSAGENYVLAPTTTPDMPWFSNYTGTSLGAFKAYLPKSAVGGASSIQFRFADATAISTVETEVAEDVIYNLAGQRVGSDYRGLGIKNGKKILKR